MTTQRSSLRALTLVVVIAHIACGGGKSEDKPPPPKTDGGPGPIAPPIAVPKIGVDRIERMNFQWGSVGSRDYAKALLASAAKGKLRDWNAIKGFAEQSLSKDAQHLGSHWLLAAAHSQLGDHAAVVDHLVTAIAADFYNYGIKFATSEDLKPFLATKHGAAVQELAAKIRDDYEQRIAKAVFVIGRRSAFRWPDKTNPHESSSRGEVYAYDRETRQYLRLTHTGDTVVGYARPAAKNQLAILTYDRIDHAPIAGAKSDDAPLLARSYVVVLDTVDYRVTDKATIDQPVREISIGYTDDRLLVTTAPPKGRWGIDEPTVWSFDKGKLGKATVSSPLPRIAFTLEEGRVVRVPEGVKAAWAGDPPAAPSLDVGGKAIAPKESGSALQAGVALAPNHLAYTTAVDPCAKEGGPSLYVVDLAKGAHIHVLTARSQFAPRWVDATTLAYEDGEGSIRFWDATAASQLPNPLVNRAGLAFEVLSLGLPCKQGGAAVGAGSGSAGAGSGSDGEEPPLPPED